MWRKRFSHPFNFNFRTIKMADKQNVVITQNGKSGEVQEHCTTTKTTT